MSARLCIIHIERERERKREPIYRERERERKPIYLQRNISTELQQQEIASMSQIACICHLSLYTHT
jgi:hypothetical protein